MLIEFLVVLVAVFAVTVISSHYIIPILKSHKMGQKILEIGPRWHMNKQGTPIMGGLCFILAILIVVSCIALYSAFFGNTTELIPLALTLCLAMFNGIIGFVDDYCKLVKKKNEGLKAYQKFILQLVAAAAYVYIMVVTNNLHTTLHIPFTDIFVELGVWYYVFAIIIITGMVNSVNLTDGIDGLATSVTLVVTAFIAFVALNILNPSMTLMSAALIGSLLAFLRKNCHVAEVFMGDTGSLFLGGAIAGVAFMINDMLVMVIASGIFIFEMLIFILLVAE